MKEAKEIIMQVVFLLTACMSILAVILICVFIELGIPFKLFLSISHCRGCFIDTKGISLDKILSLIFDIEETMKIPSTPLDLLTVDGYIDKDEVWNQKTYREEK